MALSELNDYYPNYGEAVSEGYDLTDFSVVVKGDETVGFVENILVDTDNGFFRYLIVKGNSLEGGNRFLLPIGLGNIMYGERRVYFENLTQEQIQSLPEYNENLLKNDNVEEQVRESFRPFMTAAISNEIASNPMN